MGQTSPWGGEATLARLYPGPLRIESGKAAGDRSADQRRSFLALPDSDRTRMLLPVEPKLAASALRRSRRPVSTRQRATTLAAAAGLRLGLGRLLLPRMRVLGDDTTASIEHVLAEMIGEDVRVSIFLGPPRANRKPVLQVMRPDGTLMAVAKVGLNDLTGRLAANEAEALRTLHVADLRHTRVPQLIGLREWNGAAVLVQSALPVFEHSTQDDPEVRRRAMREIAGVAGVRSEQWGNGTYRASLVDSVMGIGDPVVRDALSELISAVDSDDPQFVLGAWHGDLTAWNLAVAGRALMVWDWERFAVGVPVGFDVLHHAFLPSLKAGGNADGRAGIELLIRAPAMLKGFVEDASVARAVSLAYLVEIGRRFAVDGQSRTGTAGGDVAAWLLPVVDEIAGRRSTHG